MTDGICSVPGCKKARSRREWCNPHYRKWVRYGNAEEPPKKIRTFCTVEDCQQPSHGNGLCETHYRRMARRGSATPRLLGSVVDGKKICTMCRIDKPMSDYGVNRALASGVHIYCKSCTNDATAAYRTAVGAEVVNARAKAYRQATPNYWRAGNSARRARILGRENEPIVPTVVFDRDDWICQICFVLVARVVTWPHSLYATVDHIIPLSRGGNHLYSNCQTACWGCNYKKRANVN